MKNKKKQDSKKHLLRLYNKAIKHHEQPPPNWRDTTVKVIHTSGTHHHHRRTDPSVRSSSCTDSSASFSSNVLEHNSVCEASTEEGIQAQCIHLLSKLNNQQRATVHTDVKNKHFHLKQGTKQGDPPSTLLFNALPQYIMKPRTENVEQR